MAKVIEVLKQHERLLDVVVYALVDHVQGIICALPKCQCGRRPITVFNYMTSEVKCDRCAAELIADAQRLQAWLHTVPARAERYWQDLPRTEAIRNMMIHYDEIIDLDVVVH